MSSDVSRILKEARDQGRLTTLEYANLIFDDFMELHGDRHFADDGAIVGGIARLAGRPVTVIGIQKGKNLQENVKRNFGQPNPEGYRKALLKQSTLCLKKMLLLMVRKFQERLKLMPNSIAYLVMF